MKKEVLLAIVIGLMLGLGITYGVYQTKSKLAEPPATTTLETIATNSAQAADDGSPLKVSLPQDQSVQINPEVLVRGTTTADAYIIVLTTEEEYIGQANELGEFSVNVPLADGPNVLEIRSLDPDGVQYSVTRTVLVTAELEASPAATTES